MLNKFKTICTKKLEKQELIHIFS